MLIFLVLSTLIVLPVNAGPKGDKSSSHGHSNKGGWDKHSKGYEKNSGVLPKGLQKKIARDGKLPPGWHKKLYKGEVISSDIYVHALPLPPKIEIKLPKLPSGSIDIRIEDKIVRLIKSTRKIVEVFDLPRIK